MFRQKEMMFVILVVASMTITSLNASQEASPEELLSPRLIALHKEIQAGNRAALESFWQEVTEQGTPLIEPIPGDNKYVLATFLWRAKVGVKNVVVFSGFKNWGFGDNQIAPNQMAHLRDTDLWYKSYKIGKNIRFTYQISPNDPLIPFDQVEDNAKGWSERTATWQPDPLNPHRYLQPKNDEDPNPNWKGEIDSIVELPDAPAQPWVKPQRGVPAGQVEVRRLRSKFLNDERRVWIYTPPGYTRSGKPYTLLILFDGWAYIHVIPTPTILDNLLAKGYLGPMVAVMIDNLNWEPRWRDLYSCASTPSPFVEFLTKEMVPWARRHYHVSFDPSQTIVGGFSAGGFAAACVALLHPQTFGNVLSQSGAFHEKPENDSEFEWLARQFNARAKLPLRFYLDVGLLETTSGAGDKPSLLIANRHLRDVLQAKGYAVHYKEFNGGHEHCNWQGTLANGLLALIGSPVRAQEAGQVPTAGVSLQEPSHARIQVTRGLGNVWGTRLSPDGQQIAFALNISGTYASGATAIFVAPISGGKPIQLTTWSDQSFRPSWSPDGSQLAFSSSRSGSPDIWIMTASGTDQRRITSDSFVEEDPAWSPDGQWIAFASNKEGRWNLWIVPAAGGEPKQVTRGTAGDAWAAAWSPDSRHLLFLANWGSEKGHWHMWRAPLEGEKPIQLTHGTGGEDQPAWSPDGRWIAFISKRSGKYDLWLMPPKSGGRPQQLTDDEEVEDFPTWSRDGKWLVYDSGPWPSGIRDVWMLNVERAREGPKRRH